ncbi:hypothetical protein R5W24_002619 [Gemmata sp. JC717]|uniref:hypothetical protein n=1 Tax=Gemmata algarum TaxID=2975278 RepID=UPI0021BB9CB2|nr:hypothetical protein [Gemmata algarum]MDY3553516.1 hypothetical protein [Gemmata algarum]
MDAIPLALLRAVPGAERAVVRQWWAGLLPADWHHVAELCDERLERGFFGPVADGEAPPPVLGGHFLPHDDAWRFADWEADWREYLVDRGDGYHGNGWPETAALIASQFRSVCYLGDEPWVHCRMADWSLTRFARREWPPSAQRGTEPR